MGLDMYLYKKHYVKNYKHTPKEKRVTLTVKRDGKKYPFINTKRVTFIQESVGDWRKANHIHDWFVKKCQEGVDECQEAYVDPTKLQELLDTCKKVKAASKLNEDIIKDHTVAKELLPTSDGFFFGGTDYNNWYLQHIDDTIKILEEELAIDYGIDAPEYYYRSSW